jgi:chemotaxis protein methyltransferase CheR
MNVLELSPSVFSILSGLIEEKVGLHYGLLDRELLRDKASARAIEAGFDSMLDYYYYLRYDNAGAKELTDLVENLVVNETYFFREWPAIRVLVDNFITPWCAAGRRPRIWSAACSTGEEPLSLAMLLDQRQLLDKVEIVATDISINALAKAQRGQFGRRSVRQVPEPSLLDRYIQPAANGYTVAPEILASIQWGQQNLLRGEEFLRRGMFDIVICRNVLIYFSDTTIKNVLNNFSTCLPTDGILVVGVSESLLRYGSCFIGEEHAGSFIYRKKVIQ